MATLQVSRVATTLLPTVPGVANRARGDSNAVASGTANIALVVPAGTQTGDLLVAAMRDQVTNATVDFTGPSGWTRFGGAFIASNSGQRVTALFWKIASSTDAGTSYTFTTSVNTGRKVGWIDAYSGVDQTNPIGQTTGFTATTETNTTIAIPAFPASGNQFTVEMWDAEFASPNSYAADPSRTTTPLTQVHEGFSPAGAENTSISRTAQRQWEGIAADGGVPAHVIITVGQAANRCVQMFTLRAAARPWLVHEAMLWNGTQRVRPQVYANGALSEAVPLYAIPKQGYTSVTQMLNQTNFYIAHRGGSRDYPEMSSYAYLESGCLGFPAQEISLAKSSDGVLFGLHDASLDRTSYGTGGGTGTTYVASALTWAQIQASPGILAANAANNTTQAAQPYMTFTDYLTYFQNKVVTFLDLKAITDTATIDQVLTLMDQTGGPAKWVAKYYGVVSDGSSTWMGRAKARGYSTWGYFYAADESNYATYAPKWTYLGQDYSAPQAQWDSLKAAAPGKRVIGHICPDQAAVTTAASKGATAFMVSGVAVVAPNLPKISTLTATTKHRVFSATAAPPYTLTAYTDGTPSIRPASQFYTYGAGIPNARCVGGRVYCPAGTAAIGQTVTLAAYQQTSQQTLDLSATPIQSKTTTLTAGWNEVLWDTPFAMPSASSGGAFVSIAYEIGGSGAGTYFYVASPQSGYIGAADGSLLVLSEQTARSWFRIGTGATNGPSSPWYGSDIIVDEGPPA